MGEIGRFINCATELTPECLETYPELDTDQDQIPDAVEMREMQSLEPEITTRPQWYYSADTDSDAPVLTDLSVYQSIQDDLQYFSERGTEIRLTQFRQHPSFAIDSDTATISLTAFPERRIGTVQGLCSDNSGLLVGFDVFHNLSEVPLKDLTKLVIYNTPLPAPRETRSENRIEQYDAGERKSLHTARDQIECVDFVDLMSAGNTFSFNSSDE